MARTIEDREEGGFRNRDGWAPETKPARGSRSRDSLRRTLALTGPGLDLIPALPYSPLPDKLLGFVHGFRDRVVDLISLPEHPINVENADQGATALVSAELNPSSSAGVHPVGQRPLKEVGMGACWNLKWGGRASATVFNEDHRWMLRGQESALQAPTSRIPRKL